ncbi:G-type lectin S-receptor-like serine/threonine-protein kinase At5g24080 [Tasmannia lanceolata]|uniref:G-type lectin S-receptor-like serine/threonine-protein kinase At5g24080 n=1 Tax=Tasmannia lanceolata TaxID=3420 RepID=UPI004062DED0
MTPAVKLWIRRTDEIESGIRRLEKRILKKKSSIHCFPCCISSYRISRRATRMISDINDLCRESNFSVIPLSPRIESSNTLDPIFDEIIEEKVKMFSRQNLKNITDNFKEKLGEGGFGVVYKGILADKMLVAVKILNGNISDNLIIKQFKAEVNSIGRTNHFNLVRLCGFCFEKELKALVFEFMENGSLDSFLFDDKKRNSIGWKDQQSIAVGTARGIAYLHEDCRDNIIHYDIKPGNVLLDAKLCPKVADFGLAKICSRDASHITKTGFRGTPGYAAPEMWLPYPLTTKSDVYSFGVLLFEILGKRKHYETNALPDQEWLPRWVWKKFEEGTLGETLLGFEIDEKDKEAERMAIVALWCVQQQPEMRPSMSSVVKKLEGELKCNRPPNPFPHMSYNDSAILQRFSSNASSTLFTSTALVTAISSR